MTAARDVMERLHALAGFSDEAENLTRLYLSPAHIAATGQVIAWMREAGMTAHVDPVGNVVGRYEGLAANAPALMFGSHIDTVRNAGIYDGPLGVICAIAAVDHFSAKGRRFSFAIEVIAFGDEESARFPTALLGSRALAGKVKPEELDARDAAGISVRDALPAIGGDPARLAAAARRPEEIVAYIELHIEQGPRLEAQGLPLGVVTAINGASRWNIEVEGMAGHAGTLPMSFRRDALAAGAEMVLEVERIGRSATDLVATVGQIKAFPGATNVVPGRAAFSLDVRHPEDGPRLAALHTLRARFEEIAQARTVGLKIQPYYEMAASPCDPRLRTSLIGTMKRLGVAPFELPSGAGHDAMAFSGFCPMAMIFVRCKGGISHNPKESIRPEDAALSVEALIDAITHGPWSSLA